MVEADVTIIVRQRHADASAVRSELCEARSGSACATLLAPTVPSFALLPPAAVPVTHRSPTSVMAAPLLRPAVRNMHSVCQRCVLRTSARCSCAHCALLGQECHGTCGMCRHRPAGGPASRATRAHRSQILRLYEY